MRHSDADIEARNTPIGRVVAWTASLTCLAMLAVVAYVLVYPPACTRIDVWQFSICI